jgi:hypothetical protein
VDDIYDDDWDRLTNDKIPSFYQTYSYWLRQLNAESTKTNDQLENLLMKSLCGCDTCQPTGGFAQTVKTATAFLRTTGESTFANVENCSILMPRVDISFWKPQSVIDNCTRTCPPGCDMECSDAEGNCALFEACTACHERCYDEFHKMLYDLGSGPAPYDDGFYEWAQELCQAYKSDPKSVEKSIDEWYPQLFDSEPDSEAPDYYTILSYWQGRIKSVWIPELWNVVSKVSACGNNCSLVYNCCCPLKSMLVQTINTLTNLANEIGEFNSAVLQFNNSVGKADKKTNCGSCGSDGEFCYSWYDYLGSSGKQTQSYHHIRVKVASFSLPKLKAYRSDFKKCLKLEHHDGTAKVTIKQFDQDSSPVGPFGWIFRYNKSQTKPTTPNVLCSIPEEYWISTTGAVNWNHKGSPPKFSDKSK